MFVCRKEFKKRTTEHRIPFDSQSECNLVGLVSNLTFYRSCFLPRSNVMGAYKPNARRKAIYFEKQVTGVCQSQAAS